MQGMYVMSTEALKLRVITGKDSVFGFLCPSQHTSHDAKNALAFEAGTEKITFPRKKKGDKKVQPGLTLFCFLSILSTNNEQKPR